MAPAPSLSELERRVARDPAAVSFALLAEEYRRLGRLHDAVRVARSGLALRPEYTSARVTLGRALVELGQVDAARRELETVLLAAPENLAAIRALADLHERQSEGPLAPAQDSPRRREDRPSPGQPFSWANAEQDVRTSAAGRLITTPSAPVRSAPAGSPLVPAAPTPPGPARWTVAPALSTLPTAATSSRDVARAEEPAVTGMVEPAWAPSGELSGEPVAPPAVEPTVEPTVEPAVEPAVARVGEPTMVETRGASLEGTGDPGAFVSAGILREAAAVARLQALLRVIQADRAARHSMRW